MVRSPRLISGYVLAGSLGALVGGAIVLVISRALPKMMSKMMSGMMRNMMGQMSDGTCSPEEI